MCAERQNRNMTKKNTDCKKARNDKRCTTKETCRSRSFLVLFDVHLIAPVRRRDAIRSILERASCMQKCIRCAGRTHFAIQKKFVRKKSIQDAFNKLKAKRDQHKWRYLLFAPQQQKAAQDNVSRENKQRRCETRFFDHSANLS